MLSEKYLIFFTHIPKTGGTSFKKSVIEPNISKDKIYNFSGFGKLLFNNLNKFEFVEGHYPFGIHYFTWYTKRKYLYLVILREPLDHAISYYHFIKHGKSEINIQGIQEGRQEGEANLIIRLLNCRLGVVTPNQENQIRSLSLPQLADISKIHYPSFLIVLIQVNMK
ncbi:DUF4351 domain-containing protein [Dolichospermum circinale]|uniref:DUF4351 domain-containing protein n=1 Tax=Dolichospermum circinale TaxID=109265 RepID=UPI00232E649B|nr:DUF4351 domain-containing protein [Dolichospermum circinale]MDB9474271.1 DUF4351 domain-containing protein [Dolichospermum circinale CS-537/11]MDB9480784.1 DUF4351 domain-containing protein [Dolichospermum circinale CS-537/03]MDB9484392.1 DUF4351 domain-containing protein [Dolichospermum circinale CS-537/05]